MTTLSMNLLAAVFVHQALHVSLGQSLLLGFEAAVTIQALPFFLRNIPTDGLTEKFTAAALFFFGQFFGFLQELGKREMVISLVVLIWAPLRNKLV